MPDEKAENPRPAGRAVNVKIDDDLQSGTYANKLIVAHSREEFVLDFVADFPPGPRIVARIITTPAHLRSFASALETNIEHWTSHHGPDSGSRRRPPADA